jgi:ATP-dependent protease HslVU (ClpYQ) peptidase subunit
MSCVIGLKHKNDVYVAADGVASTEDGDTRPIKAVKIFRRGNYLLGYAGSIRTGQIIQRGDFKAPKSIWGWPDLMREQINIGGALITIGETQSQMSGSNFIIAHKGKLYETLCDFQINEIGELGFTAIGAGATIALGSLFTSQDMDFTPEQRLYLALESASEFARSCGPPYVIERL